MRQAEARSRRSNGRAVLHHFAPRKTSNRHVVEMGVPGFVCISLKRIPVAEPDDSGRATPGDLQLAERLIMALVDRLEPDSAIEV